MRWKRTVTVVAHAEGEANDVIVGGVLPPPGATMFERMRHLETRADELRQMLLFDPRGVARCVNLVTPPCDPRG
jgi:proline racemase